MPTKKHKLDLSKNFDLIMPTTKKHEFKKEKHNPFKSMTIIKVRSNNTREGDVPRSSPCHALHSSLSANAKHEYWKMEAIKINTNLW